MLQCIRTRDAALQNELSLSKISTGYLGKLCLHCRSLSYRVIIIKDMKNLIIILFLSVLSISQDVSAAFLGQYQLLYFTREDDVDQFTYNRMDNRIVLAASVDRSGKFFIGFNYHIWNKANKADASSNEDELSMTEFGATFTYFWDENRIWKTSFSYNLKASGERTTSGTTEDVDGSSMLFSIGFQVPITRKFSLGLSMNYHALTISESVTGTTSSEVSESYTTIYPMADVAFKF